MIPDVMDADKKARAFEKAPKAMSKSENIKSKAPLKINIE